MKFSTSAKHLFVFFLITVQSLFAARFKQVNVDLWPDYDQPAMLVMVEMVLDSLREVTLNVPPAVKHVKVREGYLNIQKLVTPDKDGNIRLNPGVNRFTVKYYDMFPDSIERYYEYRLFTSLKVESLIITIQKPAAAKDFRAPDNPGFIQEITDKSGYKYISSKFEDLPPGEPLIVKIRYTNPDKELTALGSLEPPEPIRRQISPAVRKIGIGLFFLMLILALLLRRHVRPVHDDTEKESNALRFCGYCGAPRNGPYVYCPYCGKKY
jgi:hypothetical protein